MCQDSWRSSAEVIKRSCYFWMFQSGVQYPGVVGVGGGVVVGGGVKKTAPPPPPRTSSVVSIGHTTPVHAAATPITRSFTPPEVDDVKVSTRFIHCPPSAVILQDSFGIL